ncbi:MAG: efflux RND transporter periplasmic adaptor subunit [Planctomycetota bacterium]|nr:efflux RND transporter periplasmic adaptor subunit [Planctomycetota bacterium]MDA1214541.1 efflux RND transporter periplasmic adaptor subunit [Planctomycetota bacterium]
MTVVLILIVLAATSYQIWWPQLSSWVDQTVTARRTMNAEAGAQQSGHHEGSLSQLELSEQARKNLGLTSEYLRPIQLRTFRRTLTVPAVVTHRPGRTEIQVSAPLTGVITHVHAVTGEAVLPGTLLFEIRLTHEDLVNAQTEFLKTLGELEVEKRELARLESITQSGAVAGIKLLERQYAMEKLEAIRNAQREALRLHGLSDRQVDGIAIERKLLRDLQIVAPDIDEHHENEELHLSGTDITPVTFQQKLPAIDKEVRPLVIDQLHVLKGQSVSAGETLCSLADFQRLYIEGRAFEQDSAAIAHAWENNWEVTALFPGEGGEQIVDGLKLAYTSNSVDPDSRTLSFYVDFDNEIVRDSTNHDNQRFISWQYRPGQRLQLLVPIEEWPDEIVLPVDAVIKDGADWHVFRENGEHFDRVPVHVKHRGQNQIVIANDGSIFPGDVIAMKSAHQMQMAIKNQGGGAIDPHAGHSH